MLLAQQPYSDRVDVSLVNVDVTVTSHGQPARGLTRDDFEILEDGKPQTITHFQAMETLPVPAAARATRAAAEAEGVAQRMPRNVFVVVDYLHTDKVERNRALERLNSFVNAGDERDRWSILMAAQPPKAILPATADKARVQEAIEAMRHDDAAWRPAPDAEPISLDVRLPYHDPKYASNDLWYAWHAYVATRSAVRALADAGDAKKVVLVLTNSFGKPFTGQPAFNDGRHFMSLREELVREANAANVNIYTLDVGGNTTITTKPDLLWLASETGGKFLPGSFTDASLEELDELTSNYYALAYRPPHGDDGKYHRITVRMKVPGRYTLQYRNGYGVLPMEVRVEQVLTTPAAAAEAAEHSALPLSVENGPVRLMPNRDAIVPVRVAVPLHALQFLPGSRGSEANIEVWISVFENGRSVGVQRFSTRAHARPADPTDSGEMTHTALVRIRPGTTNTVIVAVRDKATDAVGYVVHDLRF